ncbi:MAG: hypothetical protein ACLGHQ_11430 [Acidimicrobiia bacterium]
MKRETVEPDGDPVESGTSGPPIKLVLLLLVVAALAVFFFQNGDDASIQFLWIDAQWPVWLVIGVSVVAGVVIDRLGTWQWRRARRRKEQGEG